MAPPWSEILKEERMSAGVVASLSSLYSISNISVDGEEKGLVIPER